MGATEFYKLKDNDKREIFEATALEKNLPGFAIEKDWWVVQVLDQLFSLDIGPHMIFKGGTSLSKSWDIIDRFSEDIDLAIDRSVLGIDGELTRSGVRKLRKVSYKFISEKVYPQLKEQMEASGYKVEMKLREVESSDQDPLIIELYYPYVTAQSEYVLPRVLIEIGCRSLREPFTARSIRSFVGEVYSDRPFADPLINIPSVNVERTLLEKLFLLHEEFQRPKEKIRVERLSRHIYDIHMISKTEYVQAAIDSPELYGTIIEHRNIFSPVGGVDYGSHYAPGLSPLPIEDFMLAYQEDYKSMQESMIPGDSPNWEGLITSLKAITNLINKQEALKK